MTGARYGRPGPCRCRPTPLQAVPSNPPQLAPHSHTHRALTHTHTPAEAAIQTPLYRCGIVRAQERPAAGSSATTHTPPRAVTPTAAALLTRGRRGCHHYSSRRRRGRPLAGEPLSWEIHAASPPRDVCGGTLCHGRPPDARSVTLASTDAAPLHHHHHDHHHHRYLIVLLRRLSAPPRPGAATKPSTVPAPHHSTSFSPRFLCTRSLCRGHLKCAGVAETPLQRHRFRLARVRSLLWPRVIVSYAHRSDHVCPLPRILWPAVQLVLPERGSRPVRGRVTA